MGNATDACLDHDQRSRLAAFGDMLVPAGAGLPSASGARIHEEWVDRVLAIRSDLRIPLATALSEEGDPAAVLDHWRRDSLTVFELVAFVVTSAYFMNPAVRSLLGYPGDGPVSNPARSDEAEYYLRDGLLDVVRDRGPIYRPVPR